jgi:hypothetical protein
MVPQRSRRGKKEPTHALGRRCGAQAGVEPRTSVAPTKSAETRQLGSCSSIASFALEVRCGYHRRTATFTVRKAPFTCLPRRAESNTPGVAGP